jgi:hypothetical protein
VQPKRARHAVAQNRTGANEEQVRMGSRAAL